MKRALMPSGQAEMQLPLPLQTEAQRIASALPLPPVIKSTIPAVVSSAPASASPAGITIGQARKHSPQRVQASAIASPPRPEVLDIPSRPGVTHALPRPQLRSSQTTQSAGRIKMRCRPHCNGLPARSSGQPP